MRSGGEWGWATAAVSTEGRWWWERGWVRPSKHLLSTDHNGPRRTLNVYEDLPKKVSPQQFYYRKYLVYSSILRGQVEHVCTANPRPSLAVVAPENRRVSCNARPPWCPHCPQYLSRCLAYSSARLALTTSAGGGASDVNVRAKLLPWFSPAENASLFFPSRISCCFIFMFQFCWIELSDKLYFLQVHISYLYLAGPSRTLRGKPSLYTYRPSHSLYLGQPMDNGLLLTLVHSAQRRLFRARHTL